MIISNNKRPNLSEFKNLIENSTEYLNIAALNNPDYYIKRNAQLLEDDVKNALEIKAKGTNFENTIEKVSGQWIDCIEKVCKIKEHDIKNVLNSIFNRS